MRNLQNCKLYASLYNDLSCSFPKEKKCGLKWYVVTYEKDGKTWEKSVRLCKYRVNELGIEGCLAEKLVIEKELEK